jgi:plastocyanin
MKQFKRKHVGYLLLTSFVLSCSKNNSDDFETQLTESSSNPVVTNTIRITSAGFTPAEANTVAGNTVSWVNEDQQVHTVSANDGSFNSGDIAPGGTFAHKPGTIGDYPYHCDHHEQEKGLIAVKGIK